MADETNVTTIAADTQIKGEMTFEHSCKLLGKFDGTITAKGQLHVAEGATCKAQVEAATVIVDGLIEGNVTAKDRIQLNAKARLIGDLVASKLVMAEGASFNGHVSVGADAIKGGGSHHTAPAASAAPTSNAQGKPAGAGAK